MRYRWWLHGIVLVGCGAVEAPSTTTAGAELNFERTFRAGLTCFTDEYIGADDKVYVTGCSRSIELHLNVVHGVIEDGSYVVIQGGPDMFVYKLRQTEDVHYKTNGLGQLSADDSSVDNCFSGWMEPQVNFNQKEKDDLSIHVELEGGSAQSYLAVVVEVDGNDVTHSVQFNADEPLNDFFQPDEVSDCGDLRPDDTDP